MILDRSKRSFADYNHLINTCLGTEERDLWKLAALCYSSSQNQSLFDRAAIGALCGNTGKTYSDIC